MQSAAHTSRFWGYAMQKHVSLGLSMYDHQPYIVKKANELLFDGYEDDLISMAATVQDMGMNLNIPYKRFGWMYDVSFGIRIKIRHVSSTNVIDDLNLFCFLA